MRGNKTTLDLLIDKEYKKFFTLYTFLYFFGFFIELFGRMILSLWNYPTANLFVMNTIGLLGYPFILMSFREAYEFLRSIFKNVILSTIIAMLIGILIWELPNIYSGDWIYVIPYITMEIFHVNLVVAVGWVILIWGPVYIYRIVDEMHMSLNAMLTRRVVIPRR
jgi:hypothetical protein